MARSMTSRSTVSTIFFRSSVWRSTVSAGLASIAGGAAPLGASGGGPDGAALRSSAAATMPAKASAGHLDELLEKQHRARRQPRRLAHQDPGAAAALGGRLDDERQDAGDGLRRAPAARPSAVLDHARRKHRVLAERRSERPEARDAGRTRRPPTPTAAARGPGNPSAPWRGPRPSARCAADAVRRLPQAAVLDLRHRKGRGDRRGRRGRTPRERRVAGDVARGHLFDGRRRAPRAPRRRP